METTRNSVVERSGSTAPPVDSVNGRGSSILADAPVFGFDREGKIAFLNTACREFLQKCGGSGEGPNDPTEQELRRLAAKLFTHRDGHTLEKVGNPILWRSTWQVCHSFVQPDSAGNPQMVSLLVVPAIRASSVWPEPENAKPDDALLYQVLSTINITEAEFDVARLLWQGKLIKEIAKILHKSISTVKFHSSRLFRRCGVARRPEWMAWMTGQIRSLSTPFRKCGGEFPQVR